MTTPLVTPPLGVVVSAGAVSPSLNQAGSFQSNIARYSLANHRDAQNRGLGATDGANWSPQAAKSEPHIMPVVSGGECNTSR